MQNFLSIKIFKDQTWAKFIILTPQESNTGLHKPALEALRTQIRASTSSMTSVPKPLKFLRKHYSTLKDLYTKWQDGENRVWWQWSFIIFFLLFHCQTSWTSAVGKCIFGLPCPTLNCTCPLGKLERTERTSMVYRLSRKMCVTIMS